MRFSPRLLLIRALIVLTLTAGTVYVGWRWSSSVYWAHWWIAVPLVLAETYALVDAYLFSITMWRLRQRGKPPEPWEGASVDVFITTYDEPVEMVMATVEAAVRIRYPHTTWVLDDGDRSELREAVVEAGGNYLTRSGEWADRPRHAKAGNLNNALLNTDGEFVLILDADQIPASNILDSTLGWFRDPDVALVQTPQFFSNVGDSDPLGSQAPLFYGPIQQGKDGWNAAFFCGSNAVLRREALMQLGVMGYVDDVDTAAREALQAAGRRASRLSRSLRRQNPTASAALEDIRAAVAGAQQELSAGRSLSEVTFTFHARVETVARRFVRRDLHAIGEDLQAIEALQPDGRHRARPGTDHYEDEEVVARLSRRDLSPLAAVESVNSLIESVDVDRNHEAVPLTPMATVSVTEDMATCMRLHALGWRSVYHHEILATGLAPEDLQTMLQQRLRWAQGTLQVMLQESPLTKRGLAVGQRLMYFATMWSYLSGFAALAFIAAPVIYLFFGVLPVRSFGSDFLRLFIPYIVLNQLLFWVVGYGVKTWRGLQYSLALFPLWIRACVTAAANVWFGRPLGFVVTSKTGPAERRFPWKLVLPQLVASLLLVAAAVVGVARLLAGDATSAVGTVVNVLWIAYDLVALSVVFQAAAYHPEPTTVAKVDEQAAA